MKFNLNNDIKVKLTSNGARILADHHDERCKERGKWTEFKMPETDNDGYTTIRACDAFEIFGGYSWLCNEPFSMEIEL